MLDIYFSANKKNKTKQNLIFKEIKLKLVKLNFYFLDNIISGKHFDYLLVNVLN